MEIFIALVAGVIIGVVVTYFVARNNQKKFNKAMDIDPKAKLKEVIEELKSRIK